MPIASRSGASAITICRCVTRLNLDVRFSRSGAERRLFDWSAQGRGFRDHCETYRRVEFVRGHNDYWGRLLGTQTLPTV
jgi:hypothetical protein